MSDTPSRPIPLPRHAVMALLDEAMAQAALARVHGNSLEQPATRTVVAVDVHISFMRPATGQPFASAQVVGRGKTMVFCEAQLRDAQGELLAQALGTYRAQSL